MRKILILIISVSYIALTGYAGLTGCVSEESPQFQDLVLQEPDLEEDLSAENLIESTIPAPGSAEVKLDTLIQVFFTERIDKNSLTPETFIVQNILGPVSGEISYEEATKTATFKPGQNLSLLSNYKVTLTTGLKTPENKVLSQDYSWRFSTQDGTWEEQAKKLKRPGGAAAARPQVAIDNAGNAIVVWQQKDTGTPDSVQSIIARRYSPDQGWQNLAQPVENSAENCAYPQVAMVANEKTMVLWLQGSEGEESVYAKSPGENGIWTLATAESIESIEDAANHPRLVMDQAGNALAVWSEEEETEALGGLLSWGDIYVNQYSPETGWQENAALISKRTTDAFGGNQFPDVALGPNGSAIVVWEQRSFGWGEDFIVDSVVGNHLTGDFETWDNTTITELEEGKEKADLPRIAGDGSANYIVVWKERLDREGERNAVNSRRYSIEDGTWGDIVGLSSNESVISFMSLSIAMNSMGDAVAIWAQDDKIWARRYIADNGWEDAAVTIDHGSGSAKKPQVAIDGEGNIIAAWVQDGDIWVNRYSVRDGAWATEIHIDDHDDFAARPAIAMNEQGQAILAWERDGEILVKLFK